ncbi:MetQ/NlpA family ABC transporter substrate-binding protein [Marinicrinis sediminis]|uniref:Lipoprotein n=1 Tax=Marinicrinis sediminis TaxID=1652465 RepID=A0ABW5RDV8_9BACL
MKKTMGLFLSIALLVVLAACGGVNNTSNTNNEINTNSGTASNGAADQGEQNNQGEKTTLSVAATPVPHAEILKFVAPMLEEQGIELEIKEFTDYVQPNVQVNESAIDVNFFQHQPYLDQFNTDNGMNLISVAGIHVEPFGGYSDRITSLDELKEGAVVAIPNDPTNGGRALLLLEQQGLITLNPEAGINATLKDIEQNPQNLDIKEFEAAMLPRMLRDVDLALINTNYALEADLVPTEDALFIEGSESPYVNILVSTPALAKSEAVQKLAEVLKSEETKAYILDQYEGAVVPAGE